MDEGARSSALAAAHRRDRGGTAGTLAAGAPRRRA
jgi:hypothetical protein